MKLLPKMMITTAHGVLTGACLVFFVLVAAVGFAYATTNTVQLPGLIQAWSTTENGMPALNFQPNFAGMLVVVGIVVATFLYLTWRRSRGRSSESNHFHD